MIFELPEHKWFNKVKNRDLKEHSTRIKNFIINSKNNKTTKADMIKNSFTSVKCDKNEDHSKNLLKKSQYIVEQNKAIIKALKKNAHFDDNKFRSMGFSGFIQFTADSFVFTMTNETIDTINDDCSTILNNYNIYTLLSFFPQLAFNGEIKESKFKLPEPFSYIGYQRDVSYNKNTLSEYKFL